PRGRGDLPRRRRPPSPRRGARRLLRLARGETPGSDSEIREPLLEARLHAAGAAPAHHPRRQGLGTNQKPEESQAVTAEAGAVAGDGGVAESASSPRGLV